MSRYLMLFFTSVAEGHDQEEFHKWYNSVHLHDVVKVDDFCAAERFRPINRVGMDSGDQFLAAYEIETEDIDAAIAQLMSAGEQMQMSPSLDLSSMKMQLFESISPKTLK